MESFLSIENLTALLTLTFLEIILGIDNIIFIAILVTKLPAAQQFKARTSGIILALFFRIGLLFSLTWLMKMTGSLFTFAGHDFSGRDLILIAGGFFLIAKSTLEIREKMTLGASEAHSAHAKNSNHFRSIVIQIMLIDILFSFDSIITAVGMAQQLVTMVTAVIIAMGIMLWVSGPISKFIDRNPTIKILALAFLILIGVMLLVEGTGGHVAKGYIYFAMAFSFTVEMLNIRYRKKLK